MIDLHRDHAAERDVLHAIEVGEIGPGVRQAGHRIDAVERHEADPFVERSRERIQTQCDVVDLGVARHQRAMRGDHREVRRPEADPRRDARDGVSGRKVDHRDAVGEVAFAQRETLPCRVEPRHHERCGEAAGDVRRGTGAEIDVTQASAGRGLFGDVRGLFVRREQQADRMIESGRDRRERARGGVDPEQSAAVEFDDVDVRVLRVELHLVRCVQARGEDGRHAARRVVEVDAQDVAGALGDERVLAVGADNDVLGLGLHDEAGALRARR